MYIEDAVRKGFITLVAGEAPLAPPPVEGEEGSEQGPESTPHPSVDIEEGEGSGEDEGDFSDDNSAPLTREKIPPGMRCISTKTGEDLTPTIGDEGQIIYPKGWFTTRGIRQWMQYQMDVEVLSDTRCPYWDIPVAILRNVPIDGTPYSHPETIRMIPIQNAINRVHMNTMKHIDLYRGPHISMATSAMNAVAPSFLDGFHNPDIVHLIKLDDLGFTNTAEFDIRKIMFITPPPDMPAAFPETQKDLYTAWDKACGYPAVLQGDAPIGGPKSGVGIQSLQAEALAGAGAKAIAGKECVRRMALLEVHAQLDFGTIGYFMERNSEYPVEIVQTHFLPFMLKHRNSLNCEVSLAMADGQMKAEADKTTMDRLAVGVIDMYEARTRLLEDADAIAARQKKEAKEAAQSALPPGAGPAGTPSAPPQAQLPSATTA
jgi:hypothetical protein